MAVVIDDGLRDARAACERAFAFLMTDFGYRTRAHMIAWPGTEHARELGW